MNSSEIVEMSKALTDKLELMNMYCARISKRCLLPNGCWLVMQTNYQSAIHIGKKYVVVEKNVICAHFDQFQIQTSFSDTSRLRDDEEIALFIQSVQFILADMMVIRIVKEHISGSNMYLDKKSPI